MAKEQRPTAEKDPLSPGWQAALALVQGLLPAMTAIIGGLFKIKDTKRMRSKLKLQRMRKREQSKRDCLSRKCNLILILKRPRLWAGWCQQATGRLKSGTKIDNGSRSFSGRSCRWLKMPASKVRCRISGPNCKRCNTMPARPGRLPTTILTSCNSDLIDWPRR